MEGLGGSFQFGVIVLAVLLAILAIVISVVALVIRWVMKIR